MAEPTSTPDTQATSHSERHEKITEAVQETAKTITDTVKDEREFHRTGIRPEPGAITGESVATGALESAVKWVAGLAKDELELRATGRRPDHESLETLQAREAGQPLRGALAHTLSAEEIGLDPDRPLEPIVPRTK